MSKQSNIFSIFIFKLLAFALVFITLIFVYTQLQEYNIAIKIEFLDYIIHTNSVFILFAIVLMFAALMSVNIIFTELVNKINKIKENYRGNRSEIAISGLIESALLIALENKKEAERNLEKLDLSYLSANQKNYFKLLKALTSSETIPLSLYHYIQEYPILFDQISKKLAKIEFKLGNFDKALEYARQYYSKSNKDEGINLLLAEIYLAKKDFKAMDGVITSYIDDASNLSSVKKFSELYLESARDYLKNAKNIEALSFAKKSLDSLPSNIEAAELFAEIAAGSRNYDLVNNVLASSFQKSPSFELFLIIRKFSDMTNQELYNHLIDLVSVEDNLGLFLSISTYLEVQEAQKEILEKIR